jgi:Hint domain
MSETISGFHNTPQTLNPGTPSVAIIGTVEANGSFTTTEPFLAEVAAAIYAPASGNFTIVNSGLVVETGTQAVSYTDAGIFLGARGSIDNQGTILSDSRSGVALYRGGSLSNSGRIAGGYAGVIAGGVAFISNSGAIISDAPSNGASSGEGILLDEVGVLTNAASGTISGDIGFFGAGIGVSTIDNSGTIEGSTAAIYFAGVASSLIEHQGAVIDGAITDAQGDGYLELATGTASSGSIASFSGFQTLQVDSGANWDLLGSNSFAAYDTVINNGTLRETSADALTINGSLTGAGEIILDSTTVTLNGSVAAGQKISFSGGGDVLALGDSSDFHGTISDLSLGDSIVLISPSGVTELSFEDGILTLVPGTTGLTSLGPATLVNELSIEGGNSIESDITITAVTCFVAGTKIATPDGDVAVESLKIGDEIRTLHAGIQKVKWIGRRNYDGRFIRGNRAALPIRIRQNAIAENVPARDLWVSPGHAISIDGVLIHAARLVNGVSVIQAASVDEVTYFHIELENHEILFAENCPAESFMGEHFRQQFHNVADFGRRYPGEIAPAFACQPRLDHGFQLHAIQRRINARAGIVAPTVTGPLRGFVDQPGPSICFGWAQDLAAPEEPVCLDMLSGGRLLGRVLANLYRADVAAAGFGSGYQGFEFSLPAGLAGSVEVRRSSDRVKLAASALALAS